MNIMELRNCLEKIHEGLTNQLIKQKTNGSDKNTTVILTETALIDDIISYIDGNKRPLETKMRLEIELGKPTHRYESLIEKKLKEILEQKYHYSIFKTEIWEDDNSFRGYRVKSLSGIKYFISYSETFDIVSVERMENGILATSSVEWSIANNINKMLRLRD